MKPRAIVALNTIAILCISAVAIALTSQHVFDMRPCPWCVLQRLIFVIIAVICALAALAGRHWPFALRIGSALAALLALSGAVTAWYQYTVASAQFSCRLTFADRFMTASGLDAALPWLFGIFATCMEAKVELLGVEYALWSLALFVMLAIAAATLAMSGKSA